MDDRKLVSFYAKGGRAKRSRMAPQPTSAPMMPQDMPMIAPAGMKKGGRRYAEGGEVDNRKATQSEENAARNFFRGDSDNSSQALKDARRMGQALGFVDDPYPKKQTREDARRLRNAMDEPALKKGGKIKNKAKKMAIGGISNPMEGRYSTGIVAPRSRARSFPVMGALGRLR